ncbi:MAG TPA: LysR family transcriptional regulator [Burkholderiales bacterium]|nr:LysR family transcriptional regulator [Burkholderiales bacterium]
MDLRQLDYFVHVAELGSFSRAAMLLSTAQSALSARVRQLEVELKQPLLHRNGRGVTPTEAGKRLLQHARGILMQVSRTREELGALRGAPTGRVVIALPPTITRLLTVPWLKRFRTHFPGATLGLMEGLSTYVIEWVSTGRADIGLAFAPPPSPALEIVPLLEETMLLVARREARLRARTIALKDLPRYPLILPSRPNANRMLVEMQLGHVGLKPTIALELDSVASALDAVREGYGYTLLPPTSLRSYPAQQDLVARPVVRPRLLIQIALVVSAQRPTTPLAQQALALLREVAGEVLATDAAGASAAVAGHILQEKNRAAGRPPEG